jgi:probable HAF family extracellular repeat protein
VLVSETSNPDPNGEDFCAFGTHRQCLGASWSGGLLRALPPFKGGYNSQAYWINNAGQAVGFAENGVHDASCGSVTPFQVLRFEGAIWEPNGEIRERLPLSGDNVSFALGINEKGEAVGVSGLCSNTSVPPISPASSAPHGVLWGKDGLPIDLKSLGGSFTVPASINDRGEVAGASQSFTDGHIHPFLWTREKGIQDLGAPPGAFVTGVPCCHTINNRGQVVGFSIGPSGPHAFLWEDGAVTDLNTLIPANPGLILQFALSINDSGDIVGFGVTGTGETHGYLATPRQHRTGRDPFVTLPNNIPQLLRQGLSLGGFSPRPVGSR